MAEAAKDGSANPAAQGAGIDVEKLKTEIVSELTKATATAIAEAVKPLADNQKIMADTIAALPPATANAGADKGGKKDAAADAGAGEGGEKPLTRAELLELLKKEKETDAATAAAAAKKADARKKVIEAKGLGKVPASLLNLPDTDDEKTLGEAADKLVADLNGFGVKLPDVGGAAKDGGTAAGKEAAAADVAKTAIASGLTPGEAKLAASIKLPA